jgi:hypothetical protein
MARYGRILAYLYPGVEFTLRDDDDITTLRWHKGAPEGFSLKQLKQDANELHLQVRAVLLAKQDTDDAERVRRSRE